MNIKENTHNIRKNLGRISIYIFLLIGVFAPEPIAAQCGISINIDTTPANLVEICINDSLEINATGECILLQEDFDNMAPGSSEWFFVPTGIVYNNPCLSSSNGSSYAWFGSLSPPTRELVTKDFNMLAGGYISFEIRYGLQGSSTPCDGPDAMREGVSLQYSTDFGDTWNDIAYFAPTGNILPANPLTTLPTTFGPTNFTNWDNYTFQVPPGAMTTHTRFRWVQFYVNYYNGHYDDSWGIDNIVVSRSIALDTRWEHGPDSTPGGIVAPLVDSSFIVHLLNYEAPYDTIASDTLQVIVHPIPAFSFVSDTNTICRGDSLLISVSGTHDYIWSTGIHGDSILVSPIELTTYSVTSSDNIGCLHIDSLVIFVEPLPDILLHGDTICNGDTALLNASGGVGFLWSDGGAGSALHVVPSVSTTYTVTVTGSNNCTDTASVMAYVWQLPQAQADGERTICLGEYAGLSASGGTSYLWSNGIDLQINEVSPEEDTWYYVTVTDDNSCYMVDSVLVRVNPLKEISVFADYDTICRGTAALLEVNGGEYYLWSTGEVSSQVEVWPGATSVYSVTAYEDYYGTQCQLSENILVEVEECNTFHIGNAFVPGGFSPVFKPVGNFFSIRDYHFAIFDRWGKLVYETTDWNDGWDGTINGQVAPAGAYAYIVRFTKEYLNQSYERIGSVTVIQ